MLPWFFWIVIAGIASYTILEMTKMIISKAENARLASIESRLSAIEKPNANTQTQK